MSTSRRQTLRLLRDLVPGRTLWQALIGLAALLALACVLARAPLNLVAASVFGVGGAVLLLRRPALGIYALAIAIPFGSLRTIPLAGYSVSPSQPILAATLGAAGLKALATHRMPSARSPIVWTTLALLAVLACSLLRAQDLSAAGSELLKWIELTLVIVFIQCCTSPDERLGTSAALLLAGLAQGLLGIYQFTFQVGPPGFVLFGQYMRAYGTFSQPNPYGGYLGLLLPLALAMVWLYGGHPSGAVRRLRERGLWLLALCALVTMTAGMLMSWSRGALLGMLVGLGLVVISQARRAWPALLTLAALVILISPLWGPLLPMDLLARLDDTVTYLGQDLDAVEVDDANFSVIERLAHWQAAWRMFSSSPWAGVGVGQYPVVYPSVALARWRDPLGHAHNYYLHILAESGLPGLFAYLIWLLVAVLVAYKSVRREQGWPRALSLGALGMLGYLATHSVVDNLYVHDMYLLVAILLGMLPSTLHIGGREASTPGQGPIPDPQRRTPV